MMSNLPRAESKRLYSWWWDSHISPKNSKWLQENLKDMDMKVKAMIKLIEEDADSFARRAEMYYKKRPELMKLVEELYRAYRALAERYDHATGALRHAHRTMSEAFPNHIPLALPDESLSNNTPETPSPRHAFFDFDDMPKDSFGFPKSFNAFARKEMYPEENEALETKKGSKQFNEMFIPRVQLSEENDVMDINAHEEEGIARVRLSEGKVRKSLNFEEEEGNTPNAKIYIDSRNQFQPVHRDKENAKYGIKHLEEQVSQLSSENHRLKEKIELESKHLDLSKGEVQKFRNLVSKLESEKNSALLQNKLSNETIYNLEIEISKVKDEIGNITEEMEKTLLKLSGAEIQCVELEKANQKLQFELEEAKRELEELRLSLTESKEKHVKTEMALQTSEQLYDQSNEKVMLMTLEIQVLAEKVKEIEHFKVGLEDEIRKLKDMNCTVNEQKSECALKVTHLEAEIISSKEINQKLVDEVEINVRSKKILQEELDSLKEVKHEMDLKHESLTKQLEELRLFLIESEEKQVKTEMALQSSEQRYNQSNDMVILMTLEIQILVEKLKELEHFKNGLEDEIHKLKGTNITLNEHKSEYALKVTHLEAEFSSSKEINQKLVDEVEINLRSKEILQEELDSLKEDKHEMDLKHESLKKQLEELRLSLIESKEKQVKSEMALQSSEQLYNQSNDMVILMTLEIQILVEKLKEIEHFKIGLEDEIRKLKDTNMTLNMHKSEYAMKVTHLEAEVSSSKEINQKLVDEVEIHLRSKKILQEELDSLKEDKDVMDLKHESLTKQLEDLQLSLIECEEKQVKTEMALQSSAQLYNQSNDMAILMTLEIQILVEKLKEIELFKVGLEEEVRELKDMNHTLSEHNSEYVLKITHLEREIISLKEIIHKLEDEVEIHAERKTVLQQEFDSLKDDKNEIDLKHQSLTKEMEEASLHTEFLDTLVQKLQSGNDELEECCRKLEGEKLLFLDKLKGMESVSEKNSSLENYLSEANVELEELRERIKALEGSCEFLNAAVSTHIGENTALESEMEILTKNLQYLTVKSTILEGSLDGANTEFEELHSKLRVLEESHGSLSHENLDLLTQKNDLLSQVERLKQIVANLETTHASLEEKNLNLVNEENLSVNKILKLENSLSVLQKEFENQLCCAQENRQAKEELEETHQKYFSQMAENIILHSCLYDTSDSLIIEKHKYMSLVQSKEIQLSDLQSQIQFLQEEVKVRDNRLEEEEQKLVNSMLGIFILQKCLSELKGENLTVLVECQKLQEASRSANVLIKELEGIDLVQKENIGLLMEKIVDFENENGRLRTNLKELSPLFSSAGNAISDVEEHVHQLANLHGNVENPSSYHQENHEPSISDHDHSAMAGVLEMQNLIAKVQSLQKLVVDTKNHLDHEKLQSVANLESARREVEELKVKESAIREEKQQIDSSSNMVKDIELDQISNSCGVSRIQSAEANDPMLKLWETPERDLENRMPTDHNMGAVEEVKSQKPLSDPVAEKAIRVRKHEISREIKESQDEWNRMVIKRLATDANKLFTLQKNAEQLRLKMERSGNSAGQNRLQFDTLRAKLKEAEAAIFDLLDRNGKSTMMAEIYANSCNGEEMGRTERSEVLEQVRNGSKRIEMVELELEKIHYIFLKLEEESESYMTRAGDQTPRMLLRDYLYGRRDKRGKKRGRLCFCARPRTLD